jgi:hypothetical protein
MNTNDKKIMLLKKQIEEKKATLSKSHRFEPITNCSLDIYGARYNLHVLQKEQLIVLYVQLNSYVTSAKELGYLESFIVNGFTLTDWVKDVKAKLDNVTRKEEASNLRDMETKLNELLSNDKKVSLAIDEIENSLKK